jgi:hypothetical protein
MEIANQALIRIAGSPRSNARASNAGGNLLCGAGEEALGERWEVVVAMGVGARLIKTLDVTPFIGQGLMRVGGCGHAAAPC